MEMQLSRGSLACAFLAALAWSILAFPILLVATICPTTALAFTTALTFALYQRDILTFLAYCHASFQCNYATINAANATSTRAFFSIWSVANSRGLAPAVTNYAFKQFPATAADVNNLPEFVKEETRWERWGWLVYLKDKEMRKDCSDVQAVVAAGEARLYTMLAFWLAILTAYGFGRLRPEFVVRLWRFCLPESLLSMLHHNNFPETRRTASDSNDTSALASPVNETHDTKYDRASNETVYVPPRTQGMSTATENGGVPEVSKSMERTKVKEDAELRPRPLRCGSCGKFGHAAENCKRRKCWGCGHLAPEECEIGCRIQSIPMREEFR